MPRNNRPLPPLSEEDEQLLDNVFEMMRLGCARMQDDAVGPMVPSVLERIPIEYLSDGLLDPALLR